MDQPPGSVDDLQPQDLSTSTVTDLTKRGEECILDPTAAFDTLRMVKTPSWYSHSGNGGAGLHFSETAITHQSGDQIQPDDAFSPTTVTLSYVSRSHIYSVQDSLYSVPPIGEFSLHPVCTVVGETGYALDRRYDEPMDLATSTEFFQALSQSQVGEMQEPGVFNGQVFSSREDVEQPEEGGGENEHGGHCLENGGGVCDEYSPERLATDGREDKEEGDPKVLFVLSKIPDPAAIPESPGFRDPCPLNREYASPLEDPISPSATSLDDVDDAFMLPQTSNSPSSDTLCLETAEAAWESVDMDGGGGGVTNSDASTEKQTVDKGQADRQKAVLQPLVDLTEDLCVSEDISKTIVPHMNGNAKALGGTLKERKLPLRSGRGMRLEAIVMNINSSRYKLSGCMRTNKKASASRLAAGKSGSARPKRNSSVSAGKRKDGKKASLSAKTTKRKALKQAKRVKSNNANSTSDSESIHVLTPHYGASPKSPEVVVRRSKREQAAASHPSRRTSPGSSPQSCRRVKTKVVATMERLPPTLTSSKPPKKSRLKPRSRSPRSKKSPTAKTKRTCASKRRKKKCQHRPSSSMFSPKEPEIKLKYVNYKEEKRDARSDTFSPFIRLERRQLSPSLCTIVNYPEETRTPPQQQAHAGAFMSGAVPSTSCLQLGQASMHGQHQRFLVCCLCGRSANTMDLGDLHGPYYPEGYRPRTDAPTNMLDLRVDRDDYSDSDSSSCSMRRRDRKRATLLAPWAQRQGSQPKPKGLVENHRWGGVSVSSPAAKQAQPDNANMEDWYSPPVVPLESREYWLHEDCGIWSAGVFLVKGRVFGLEEAVRAAQEMTCSTCHDPGATLGCFFKGCPNKYHYRCALESDCVLNEENFSMKCRKHKNKSFKAPPINRCDDR
ncbi:uncharacterized protein KZ484_016651 isoform 2-T2 [Pholidichthys leucotaenia]